MKTTTFFQTLLLTLLMAGAITNRAHAQYQSFFGDSITEYTIGTFETMYDPYFFGRESHTLTYNSNDTILFHGKTYHKTMPMGWEHYYIREDTTLGQLYRFDMQTDTEYLICDMSLEVGDTFVFPRKPDAGTMSISGVVDSVVYLNGKKTILFRTDMASNNPCNCPISLYFESAADDEIPFMFIEGIGPNYTPFGWTDNPTWECEGGYFVYVYGSWTWNISYPLLLCVHKNGELVYMADERAGCSQSILSVKEEESYKWTIYPNPAHNSLNIKFENMPMQKGMLYITDMMGRVVYSQTTDDSHLRVNIKNLDVGPYIATWLSGGKKQSMKFIKK